jgi:hypothetical protein
MHPKRKPRATSSRDFYAEKTVTTGEGTSNVRLPRRFLKRNALPIAVFFVRQFLSCKTICRLYARWLAVVR